MQRDTLIQLIAVAVLLACLAASGMLATQLAASAGRARLGYTDRAEDGDPPQVALGIAMGAFRGLFVNMLWIRANALKEAGRYYEANDLASTITKLQPRFPQVWAFHAWNMAYNISVTTQTNVERWQWVQAGIRLLRDEGIPANPNDLLIHRELAWTYLHKVQANADDANVYYKRQVAGEFTILFGPPPPPDPSTRERAAAIAKYVQWLSVIANAPDSVEAVAAKSPLVAELITRLKSEVAVDPDLNLLRRYEAHRALAASGQRFVLEQSLGERNRAMAALVGDPKYQEAWAALIPTVRKLAVINDYHMEPQRMIRYTEKYGPIDWRHPAAHALYWSARGVENSIARTTERNVKDIDLVNADRNTIQALQELFRSGELYFDFFGFVQDPQNAQPFYATFPNVHFVRSYGDVLAELVERGGVFEDQSQRTYTMYAAGYENFMKDAIRFYFRRGQLDLAEEYYRELGTWDKQNRNDPERFQYFAQPLADFVRAELMDRLTTPDVARAEVAGALQAAYTGGLLAGDDELFRRQLEYARQAHKYYFDEQGRQTIVDPNTFRMEQMPRDFAVYAGFIFAQLLAVLNPDDAERVYDRAPTDLRVYAYDLLQTRFRQQMDAMAQAGGRGFDEVYPQPEGLAEHRQKMDQLRRQQEARQLEVAPK